MGREDYPNETENIPNYPPPSYSPPPYVAPVAPSAPPIEHLDQYNPIPPPQSFGVYNYNQPQYPYNVDPSLVAPPILLPSIDPNAADNGWSEQSIKKAMKKMGWGEKRSFKKLSHKDQIAYLNLGERRMNGRKLGFKFKRQLMELSPQQLAEFWTLDGNRMLNKHEKLAYVKMTPDERMTLAKAEGIMKATGESGTPVFFGLFALAFWIALGLIVGLHSPNATKNNFPAQPHVIFAIVAFVFVQIELFWVVLTQDGRLWAKKRMWWLIWDVFWGCLCRYDLYGILTFAVITSKTRSAIFWVALAFAIVAAALVALPSLTMMLVSCGLMCPNKRGMKESNAFADRWTGIAFLMAEFQLLNASLFDRFYSDQVMELEAGRVPQMLKKSLLTFHSFANIGRGLRGFVNIPFFIIQTIYLANTSQWNSPQIFVVFSTIIGIVVLLRLIARPFRCRPMWHPYAQGV